jgi:hypothetical protein
MAVGVERDRNAGMAEPFRDHLCVDAGLQGVSRVRVSKVV